MGSAMVRALIRFFQRVLVLGLGILTVWLIVYVFRWVDQNGQPHYSDQWMPGSTVVKTTARPPSEGVSASASGRLPTVSVMMRRPKSMS